MLGALFVTVVMFPIAFIASRKNVNDPSDLEFDNGIIRISRESMSRQLMGVLDKNMRKKIKVISEEQWIEVFETSFEFAQINYEMAKKINISDLIKKKMANGSIPSQH